jgi:Fe-S-cluster-containing hydrogenase component 2
MIRPRPRPRRRIWRSESDERIHIQCPTCGAAIPLTEALVGQVRATVETDVKRVYEARLQSAVEQVEACVKAQNEQDLKLLREQLAEQERKTREAQDAELALGKEKVALEAREPGAEARSRSTCAAFDGFQKLLH